MEIKPKTSYKNMIEKIFVNILAAGGLFILVLCFYGCLKSLRNPSIYFENKCLFEDDITMDYNEAIDNCKKENWESTENYVSRVCKLVSNSMAHYWDYNIEDKYFQRNIPFWENYVMRLAHLFIPPNQGRGYEFINYKKAIERGFGLCSQHCLAAIDILKSAKIEARLVTLQRHIVVTVQHDDNSWYIIDPDFGVIIPFDLDTIQTNTDLVIPYYLKADFVPVRDTKEYYASRVSKYYNRTGNTIHSDISGYCGRKTVWLQKGSYILKWIIPILLIMPFIIRRLSFN
ncbi:MAG: hypothetical protein GY839_15170 [candidate division Zixibacteria bacterium]|nr:hypothetical protein [candidate division Zixibacteria bacterium]